VPVGRRPAEPQPWPLDQGADAGLLLDVAHAFEPMPGRHIGVAVSGGGDSVALLHLMVRACRHEDVPVSAVTVDHRLRDGSAAEAAGVAALCRSLGVPHETVQWQHGAVAGNLMDSARRARMALIGAWAQRQGVTHIALGHTADDQAETFLMALARSSGLDGLVGMRRTWTQDGLRWGRPLLATWRKTLRAYLRRHGIGWAEDPTNDNAAFERVRARQVLAALAPLGIDAERIGQSVSYLRFAKWALDDMLRRAIESHVTETAGALRINRAGFSGLPQDVQRQLLVAALGWLSSSQLPPRTSKQFFLLDAARDGCTMTLQGCRLRPMADHLLMAREPRAVATRVTPTDALWDGRWRLTGPHAPTLCIRALGARGLPQAKGWRSMGLPREALLVTPAVWEGETLLAAPLAGMENGWKAHIATPFHSFRVTD
jgi:tRNA(Ile)-lysidine synthase